MPQRQCPHCGRLGARVEEHELREAYAQPHHGERGCCAHVTAPNRLAALAAGGRYFDGHDYVCFGCRTAPAPAEEEWDWLDARREAEQCR